MKPPISPKGKVLPKLPIKKVASDKKSTEVDQIENDEEFEKIKSQIPGNDEFEQLMKQSEGIIAQIESGSLSDPEQIQNSMNTVYANLNRCNEILEDISNLVEDMEKQFENNNAKKQVSNGTSWDSGSNSTGSEGGLNES